MSNRKVEPLVGAIQNNVKAISQSRMYSDWEVTAKLKEGDVVLLNNSFLYREKLRTRKSELYLGFAANEGPDVAIHRLQSAINVAFKRLTPTASETAQHQPLDEAVGEALDDFGVIAFSLVGEVGERRDVSVPLTKVGDFDTMRFDATQEEMIAFIGDEIRIGRFEGVDVLWHEVERHAETANIGLGVDSPRTFDTALTTLQEEAARIVQVNTTSEAGPSILTEILERINEQIAEYEHALTRLNRSQATRDLNDILRISYNFADGARSLIGLITGLSDLKPLVFWLTAREQFALAEAFGQLPFSRVGKEKPSIDRYRSVIASARNGVFHDLFGFGSAFQIRLTGDAIKAPELRLFRDYANRREPALEFQDRELVALLEDFTRSPERPVPDGFWDKNLVIMKGLADLVSSVNRALVMVHSATMAD